MSGTILVIDDDEKLNRLLKRFFKDYGFEVYAAVDADQGLKKLRTVLPDLIILDIMLPGMNGFDVCKRIRESSTVPIIMLTARGDVMDRWSGWNWGLTIICPNPSNPANWWPGYRPYCVGPKTPGRTAVDASGD